MIKWFRKAIHAELASTSSSGTGSMFVGIRAAIWAVQNGWRPVKGSRCAECGLTLYQRDDEIRCASTLLSMFKERQA